MKGEHKKQKMGTRSTIKFYLDKEFICGIYQQYDGYPDSIGKEIKDFIKSKEFVNGITSGKEDMCFNGFGCFVAQFISQFKTTSGGLYMTGESDEQEYNYVIEAKQDYKKDTLTIKVKCEEEPKYKQTFKFSLN